MWSAARVAHDRALPEGSAGRLVKAAAAEVARRVGSSDCGRYVAGCGRNRLWLCHLPWRSAHAGPHEVFKTVPDKNVYLTMAGHHYLFQGHEGAPHGYMTRIDLDQTDLAKRVLLLAETDVDGNKLRPRRLRRDGQRCRRRRHCLQTPRERRIPARHGIR